MYFEDVVEGAALPALEKRPATRQLVMYAGASGDFYEVHYDQGYARARGLPDVIVHGALKNAFLAQMVTDWMGTEGTLKRLSVQYRGMDVAGRPIRCEGRVVRKYVENEEHLVDCEVWTKGADGERTTVGSAVVGLPSRGHR